MLFQRKCLLPVVLFICPLIIVFVSCKQNRFSSPADYDLNNPKVMELGKVMVEISGLEYKKDGESLLAVSDSKRSIFQIDFKKSKLSDYTDKVVPPDSDLEEIVHVNGSSYLLSGVGILYEVPDNVKDSAGVVSYKIPSEGKNDFE